MAATDILPCGSQCVILSIFTLKYTNCYRDVCLSDAGVTSDLSVGNTAADSANRLADQVLASDGVLQRQVEFQEASVAGIETTYNDAVALESKITVEGEAQSMTSCN